MIAALAASIVENYRNVALTLYRQARLCIEEEELKVRWRNCMVNISINQSCRTLDHSL